MADLGTEACEVESEQRVAEPIAAVADPITVPLVHPPIASNAPPLVPASTSTVTIKAIGAKLIAEKRQDREWDDKTCRQAEFIFTLFGRFLREEHGLTDLAGLRQTHCDAFDGFLRALFKSVGKSPKDKGRSIRELRRISEAKKPDERDLESGTRNRHLTFLGQALVRARKAAVAIDPGVSLTEFRARKKKRGRDQRLTPPSTALETFFSLPVFTGWRAVSGAVADGGPIHGWRSSTRKASNASGSVGRVATTAPRRWSGASAWPWWMAYAGSRVCRLKYSMARPTRATKSLGTRLCSQKIPVFGWRDGRDIARTMCITRVHHSGEPNHMI